MSKDYIKRVLVNVHKATSVLLTNCSFRLTGEGILLPFGIRTWLAIAITLGIFSVFFHCAYHVYLKVKVIITCSTSAGQCLITVIVFVAVGKKFKIEAYRVES